MGNVSVYLFYFMMCIFLMHTVPCGNVPRKSKTLAAGSHGGDGRQTAPLRTRWHPIWVANAVIFALDQCAEITRLRLQ